MYCRACNMNSNKYKLLRIAETVDSCTICIMYVQTLETNKYSKSNNNEQSFLFAAIQIYLLRFFRSFCLHQK